MSIGPWALFPILSVATVLGSGAGERVKITGSCGNAFIRAAALLDDRNLDRMSIVGDPDCWVAEKWVYLRFVFEVDGALDVVAIQIDRNTNELLNVIGPGECPPEGVPGNLCE